MSCGCNEQLRAMIKMKYSMKWVLYAQGRSQIGGCLKMKIDSLKEDLR